MKMQQREIPVIFTPGNESYLGRELLFHFDELISSAMEQNAVTAPKSHGRVLRDHQNMACQVIAQAISITLSIRELIRQGYLFGAQVLLRALVERAAILLYLNLYPEDIEQWKRGWHQKDNTPGLAKMFDKIQAKQPAGPTISGRDLTASMNSLLHSKPDSAPWTHGSIGGEGLRSRGLQNPEPARSMRRSLRERYSLACSDPRNDGGLLPG